MPPWTHILSNACNNCFAKQTSFYSKNKNRGIGLKEKRMAFLLCLPPVLDGKRKTRDWEPVLEKMTSRIKSHPEPAHHYVNTPASLTHPTSCIQIQTPIFLTSTHSGLCCHSILWQSGEKVWCSIIPLFTGQVWRPWPPRLNFKWITQATFMWNVKQYSTWQAITLGDVSLSRGHSCRHCCCARLHPFAWLLIDISLEFGPSVAGSLRVYLDRNSIWASTGKNELGEKDEGRKRRRREREGGWESATRALEVTEGEAD